MEMQNQLKSGNIGEAVSLPPQKAIWKSSLLLLPLFFLPPCLAQDADKPELRKDEAQFLHVGYLRSADDAFSASITEPSEGIGEVELLQHWVQAGKWAEIHKFLKTFEPERARRIHDKITGDLSYRKTETALSLQDFVSLTDSAPTRYDGRFVPRIAVLLQIAMQETESQSELVRVMKKGTVWFGDDTEDRRKYTAEVLAYAKLYAAAAQFGATDSELRAAGSRDADEREAGKPGNSEAGFDDLLAQLNSKEHADKQEWLLESIYRKLADAPPDALDRMLAKVAKNAQAFTVCAMLGRESAACSMEENFDARTKALSLQAKAIRTIPIAQLSESRWDALVSLMEVNWLKDARISLERFPTWIKYDDNRRDKYAHVLFEDLLDSIPAPDGRTMAARLRVPASRIILATERISRVVPHLSALMKTDETIAVELANLYIQRWAELHDPNLSEELLKQYQMDAQSVVLTRAEQEASLEKLGKALQSLDPELRKVLETEQLARAFDHCHSEAEIHTYAHVEKVFGPIGGIAEDLVYALAMQMRKKLSGQWRGLEVQEDAATKRSPEEVMALVKTGYAEAARLVSEWLEAHPGNWKLETMAGALHADRGEFAYYKNLAKEDGNERFKEYLEHSAKSLEHFRKGAAAYAKIVGDLTIEEYELAPFEAWFHGLLGITGPEDVNLRKGVTEQSLEELRDALAALPGKAAGIHLKDFSSMVAKNLSERRIAPEMKYRYLSSAVKVTGNQPTIYAAADKIQYYDSLLSEVRLQTRVDGSASIRPGQDFGLFVSLAHTTEIARESGGFSNYLKNHVRRQVRGNTVTDKPMYRDRLEEALRVGLGNFFEVLSVKFAYPDVQPRDLPGRKGWQETPLAYVLLKTDNLTVDRIPSLEMELDFFDRSGKVVLPVPSNPVQIEVKEDAGESRPATDLAISQIVDARALSDGELKVDVSVTAKGLVPSLDSLLDLENFAIPVESIDDRATVQLTKLITDEEEPYVTTERSWTLHLDTAPMLKGASGKITFDFPAALSGDTKMGYFRYDDMDPVEASANLTLLEGGEVEDIATRDNTPWIVASLIIILAAGAGYYLYSRKQGTQEDGIPPLFHPPGEYTPFSVLALLNRIQCSQDVRLSTDLSAQLQTEIHNLEQQAFSPNSKNGEWEPNDLRHLTNRWLENANRKAAGMTH